MNGLEIEEETTHGIVRWTRVAWKAPQHFKTPRAHDLVGEHLLDFEGARPRRLELHDDAVQVEARASDRYAARRRRRDRASRDLDGRIGDDVGYH